MKKLISLILTICLLMTVMPLGVLDLTASAETEYTSGYYTYNVIDGEATITDFNEYVCGDVTIPYTLGGYMVTSIGDSAFERCDELISVIIPDSITSIGAWAFSYCSSLTSITIGDSVTSIGNGAFYDCYNLLSISIPNSVTSVGDSAFSGCRLLTSITIPDSVTSIGDGAFHYCSSLTNVCITDVATWCNIDFGGYYSNPLYYANNLYLNDEVITDLIIPDNVTYINDYAFEGCSSFTSVTIPDSVESIGSYAFEGCSSLTSIIIPDSVTNIGEGAFKNCISLQSITLPFVGKNRAANETFDAVFGYIFGSRTSGNTETTKQYYSSDKWGFYYIPSSLETVIITDTTQIPFGAFYGCTNIKNITIPDKVTSVRDVSFKNTGYYNDDRNWENGVLYVNNHLIDLKTDPSEIIVKEGTRTIAERAFYNSYSLTNIYLPNSLINIGDYAFAYSNNLKSIVIPNSVTAIGANAFYSCKALESASLSCNLSIINEYTFYNCIKLTSIVVPDGVTTIGIEAFNGCESLANITIPDSVIVIKEKAFYNTSYYNDSNNWTKKVLYINNHLIEAIGIESYYTIKSGTKTLANRAFYGCKYLTNVTIPDSVVSIGEYAFYGCEGLESVNIPEGVTNIYKATFSGCYWLKSITIPNGVTSIDDYAFENCSRLTSVTIPNNVKSMGKGVFQNCYHLTDITLPFIGSSRTANRTYDAVFGYIFGYAPSSDYRLPEDVFQTYYYYHIPSSLVSVTVTDDISITSGAFENCSNLVSIDIGESTGVDANTFYGCSSLTSINVSESNTLYKSADGVLFDKNGTTLIRCPGGKKYRYTLPEGVTSIGSAAFNNCDSITQITLSDSVTSIDSNAFVGCDNLTNVILGKNLEIIGRYAFNYCTNLERITIPCSLTDIAYGAFENCSRISYVYYQGNKKSNITIENGNTYLNNAYWHYNSCIDNSKHTYNGTCDDVCNVCGYIRVVDVEHTFDNVCDTVCNVCGYVRATDHNFEWIIDRNETCGDNGYKHEECSICHLKRNENTLIFATGEHIYENACDTACNVCNSVRTITHNFEWIIDKYETCGENGYKHEECSVCHLKRNENTVIIATGEHVFDDYKDFICDICGYIKALPTPENLYATLYGYDDVRLSWDAVEGANRYYVSYKKSSELTYTKAYIVTGNTWSFSNLADNTNYDFSVIAVADDAGEMISSDPATIRLKTSCPLGKVSTFTATLYGHDDVELNWGAVAGATGYKVYYKKASAKNYTYLTTTPARTYSIANLTDNCKYNFKIVPVATYGTTTTNGTAKVVAYSTAKDLAAPKTLKASLYGYDDAKLTWSAVSGASRYKIYYKLSSADTYKYKTYTTKTSYNFANLYDGVSYDFKIVPCSYVNGTHFEDNSYKTVTISSTINLTAPTKVTPKLCGYDDVELNWTAVENATAYKVYYKKSTSKTYTLKTTTTALSQKIWNLSDGIKYDFKIVPCTYVNGSYFADDSYKTASIYTLKKISTPTVTKHKAGKVKITWGNIQGESGYEISRSNSKTGTYIVSDLVTTTKNAVIVSATKGKTYYYKVRAYKIVDGVKIYSPWSSVKSYKLK